MAQTDGDRAAAASMLGLKATELKNRLSALDD
jgi:hypothetical protein